MDEYLKCLYDHILGTRRDETLTKTAEYRTRRTTMLLALEVMEAGLTEEQQKKVDHYLSCQDRVSVLESDWLFQEAVALGEWLSRPHIRARNSSFLISHS